MSLPTPPLPEPDAASSGTPESMAPAGPDAAQDGHPAAAPSPVTPPATLSPTECAARLKQLFPALFSGAVKPLKLRIQSDIQERAPGVFTKQALSAFLRRHTGSTSYLIAVTRAKHRFDLDGQPAGELSEEHRKVAMDELARRRTLQDNRRAQEDQERRERAGLLRDFERTTLTVANFCALKGVPPEELDALLALARQEAAQRPPPAAAGPRGSDAHHRRRDEGRPPRGEGPGPREGRGRNGEGPAPGKPRRADKPAR